MLPSPLKPFYKHGPIRSLATLAEVLEVTPAQLERLARNADRMYRPVQQKKRDGSVRMTWDAYRQLKEVQHLIKVRILARVSYPLYLQGGIRDRENPRDYARNAGIHAGQACVINEDIADFFPSTTDDRVRDIWEHFFRFSPAVAACLTLLTTRRGELPQGAKTSNHLANLAFWRSEHDLVRYLRLNGWAYSRLTDDITVSFSTPAARLRKSRIVSILYAFIKNNGYRPKYRKHSIFGRNEQMLVNGLVVNKRPALTQKERQSIRALVNRKIVGIQSQVGNSSDDSLARVLGKIGKLKRFHKRTGNRLGVRLGAALRR